MQNFIIQYLLNLNSTIVKIFLSIIFAGVLSHSLSFILKKVNILEKFSIAINDIDFTDLYYQKYRNNQADTNIVVINIGYNSRSEIADLIRIISESNPKVIGADVIFHQDMDAVDTLGTSHLISQTKAINNLVLASSYKGKNDQGIDKIFSQSPLIRRHSIEGIVNLNIATDDPEHGTVRSFYPVTKINDKDQLSFGFLVASFLDSTLLKYASEDEMMIRWYGYANYEDQSIFKSFDYDQILNRHFRNSELENKIVLLGFMGEEIGNYEPGEIYFTPLNRKLIGRSLPDMYGIEVHANIIKMIIDKDFIFHSRKTDLIFNLIFLSLLSYIMILIRTRYEKKYSILSKIALILFVDLFVLSTLGIFSFTNGDVKFLIGTGLFIMLFIPDTYEYLDNNLYKKFT